MNNKIIGFLLRLYFKTCGIKVKTATNQRELNEAYSLRKRVYENTNYSEELHYPDEYDNHSIIFNAYKKNAIVGTMRLSEVSKGALCFDFCNPKIPKKIKLKDIIEYGALVVDKSFRKKNSIIFLALTESSYRYSVKKGFQYWYGFSISNQIKHFQKINPHCTILETNTLSEKNIDKRKRFSTYFEKYGDTSKPFLFDLQKVDYSIGMALLLKGLFKKGQRK